jgi:hypothetical protein
MPGPPRTLDLGTMSGAPAAASRQLLLRQLAAALLYSSAFAIPLFLLAPATLALYGKLHGWQVPTYALLLAVQWANGVSRPAVRHAVVEWDARRIGVAIGSGAAAVVLTCALGVSAYGARTQIGAQLAGRYVLKPNPPPTCSVWPVTKPAS